MKNQVYSLTEYQVELQNGSKIAETIEIFI